LPKHKRKKGKLFYFAEYAFARAMMFLVQVMPMFACRALSAFLGNLLYYGSSKRRGIAIDNLTHALGDDYNDDEIKGLARRSCASFLLTFMEMIKFRPLLARPESMKNTRYAEQEVFKAMFDAGDQEAIKTKGFSLLDMKNYLENIGFHADGYKAGLAKLAKVGIPAIVLIEIRGYRHFVVVKGVRDGEVVVGDPALGVRIYPRADFEKLMVNHIIFVIRDEVEVARRNFNADRDWAVRAKAPFGTAFGGNSLASFTLLMPGPNAL